MAMDKKEFETVIQSIKANTCEAMLSLSVRKIDDAQARTLAEALATNKTVQILYLSLNQIGDAGAKVLLEMLQNNKTLQDLSIHINNISDALQKDIKQALERNKAFAKQQPTVAAPATPPSTALMPGYNLSNPPAAKPSAQPKLEITGRGELNFSAGDTSEQMVERSTVATKISRFMAHRLKH